LTSATGYEPNIEGKTHPRKTHQGCTCRENERERSCLCSPLIETRILWKVSWKYRD